MFSQVSISASTIKPPNTYDVKRSIAKFHPSVWKDHFLSLTSHDLKVDEAMEERAKQLKEEVKKMLIAFVPNSFDKLGVVDSIQRLGISYHFEKEIDQVLQQIHVVYKSDFSSNDTEEDLNTIALLFRLLRQQGYKISWDIFTKFIGNDGKFKELLVGDARGMLSLYEAAHMRVHGEDVLDEALDFTFNHLTKLVLDQSSSFATEISNALKQPLRKGLPRMKAREYMVIYEQEPSHNDALLTFSKLDFNILQKLHQKELNVITRWWKDLDFSTNLPFARDRIVECYFWIFGVCFEPHFDTTRKILTKVIVMTSVLDDIYDAYGTFEELQILTATIKKWDISTTHLLPACLKIYYKALLDLYEEIGSETGKDGRSFQTHFAKEAMKKQAESYFKEAEWLNKRYKPSFEEYMEVASDSSGYELLATTLFLSMGNTATMEVFKWLSEGPKIIKASTIIARLMDDLVSYKFEQQREHIVSAVECYMDQYGCSEEETIVEIHKQVSDAWKDINKACLRPTTVPLHVLTPVLNLARVMDVLYSDEDGYTNAKGRTRFLIKSLLVDPIPC